MGCQFVNVPSLLLSASAAPTVDGRPAIERREPTAQHTLARNQQGRITLDAQAFREAAR